MGEVEYMNAMVYACGACGHVEMTTKERGPNDGCERCGVIALDLRGTATIPVNA